jgi:hypothetical protein
MVHSEFLPNGWGGSQNMHIKAVEFFVKTFRNFSFCGRSHSMHWGNKEVTWTGQMGSHKHDMKQEFNNASAYPLMYTCGETTINIWESIQQLL